ncbi:putative two-component histidine kinase [Gordonia effusa NBRC 100432]|uniref:Putative two-component histidine kinase n=1 Tax=Gordonia effusa NBRC 100432 TaxID=1077974 RepID=H0R246_9ACTN|nr:GAF domain-containing sensor histidine kinase [Gordonia effusa]GAB19151.1 putative two-component histidine kinase [Gordonia effusa NBRC 100432]
MSFLDRGEGPHSIVGDIDDPRQLRELLDAVLVVGRGLDLDEALQRIVDVAARVLGARYCALGVRAEHSGLLKEFVYTGIDERTRASMGHLPVGHGVLGVLLDDPHVLRIGDLRAHPASVGFPPNHPPMKTFLGAPILVRGNIFGSIYLTEKQSAARFDSTDEAMIGVLAVAAGVAVDNARLFEQTRIRQRWVEVLARRGSEPLAGIALRDTLDGLCADVAELTGADGVALFTAYGGQDRRLGGFGADVTAEADWVIDQPLTAGDSTIGRLSLTYARDPHLPSEVYAGLAGVAEIASLAIAYDERQQIARDLEVLEDRHRIARDLHDHVIQRLFAIGIALQTMSLTPGSGSADLESRLAAVIGDLDSTVAQIRTSIFELQSVSEGASEASIRRRVLDVIEQLAAHAHLTPTVRFDGAVDTLVPTSLASHLEAVVREGLSNALRHSAAVHVEIVVAVGDQLIVTVTDDGDGMPEDAQRRGLRNLADRAVECGGTLTVAVPHGGGTELTWAVPLVD